MIPLRDNNPVKGSNRTFIFVEPSPFQVTLSGKLFLIFITLTVLSGRRSPSSLCATRNNFLLPFFFLSPHPNRENWNLVDRQTIVACSKGRHASITYDKRNFLTVSTQKRVKSLTPWEISLPLSWYIVLHFLSFQSLFSFHQYPRRFLYQTFIYHSQHPQIFTLFIPRWTPPGSLRNSFPFARGMSANCHRLFSSVRPREGTTKWANN